MGMAVNVLIMGMAVGVGVAIGVRAVLSVVIRGVLARLKDVADDLIDLLVQFDRGEHGRSVTCGEREGGKGAVVSTGMQKARSSAVGHSPRILAASRAMTSRSAPTASARSILLMTRRSDCVTPGPPLRGTLSPPATSIT